MYKFYLLTGLASPVFFRLLFLACTVLCVSTIAAAQSMLLPRAQLQVGPHAVNAEIAATDASRAHGLMHRTSLAPDHGMLFVFDKPAITCFWMKDTPLPLSIAFVDATGIIVNIADMQPRSLTEHCPVSPVVYALEMEKGWFKARRIGPGAKLTNLPQP
ncbi:MAG TPA: DUF192 domain-containing protein [Candidimonas sp.]|nr:DUF192 domain-containing protein [Candidimonas sp.]